jgi:hypothetical protein
MLTLDIEVGFIWSARWSVPKVLYIMVAYLGLLISMVVPGNCLFHSRLSLSHELNLHLCTVSRSVYLPSSCTRIAQACESEILCVHFFTDIPFDHPTSAVNLPHVCWRMYGISISHRPPMLTWFSQQSSSSGHG